MRVDRFDPMASNVSISPAVAPNYNSDVDWCRVRREEEGIDTLMLMLILILVCSKCTALFTFPTSWSIETGATGAAFRIL